MYVVCASIPDDSLKTATSQSLRLIMPSQLQQHIILFFSRKGMPYQTLSRKGMPKLFYRYHKKGCQWSSFFFTKRDAKRPFGVIVGHPIETACGVACPKVDAGRCNLSSGCPNSEQRPYLNSSNVTPPTYTWQSGAPALLGIHFREKFGMASLLRLFVKNLVFYRSL